jgi:hypothetical protein
MTVKPILRYGLTRVNQNIQIFLLCFIYADAYFGLKAGYFRVIGRQKTLTGTV